MKLLVSDLDGTLLTKDKQITAGVRESLEKWRAEGNSFVISTGRLFPSAAYYREELGMQAELVCCSGAVIYRGEDVVMEHSVDPLLAERLWHICSKRGVYAQYYSYNSLIANQDGEFMKGYRKGNSFRQASHQVQLEVRKKLHVKEPIHKISFITWDPAEAQDILKEMQPLKGVHVFRSLAYLYDIISDESSKGSSARYLKETMGAKKLYGIGDNENDVDLLREADHSACMASAPESVLAHADVIVPDSEEDGVAVYIDSILRGEY
ncbi:MAG: HAD family phosphatase [Tissierellia bacterium]|nr:HAD family hydrolase [Bacillota bacterium]NLL22590.1 HAD family phosphatase [Tissierellia bacterium]